MRDAERTPEARKLRPLNTPSTAEVRTDERGRPTAVRAGGPRPTDSKARTPADAGFRSVLQIREVWRIDDEWWRQPVSRLYFDLVLDNGRRAVFYRDLAGGGWYRQEE